MTTATAAATPGVLERYEAVIGIEVHCQLRTVSKMFCACSTAYDGAPPNSHVCPVCLGLPGAMPVINRQAVEHVLTTGLAIEATLPAATRWDRKNYFYPDLPKGYQISQYDLPLASRGRLTIATSEGPFTIGITRAHLEEDTAKLVHATGPDGSKVSLVDFNRSGAPLMEIVTEPDIRTAEQARRYAEELQLLLRSVGASDADMERGQMRVEANVSLRARGTEPFGTRVEVKNMNSFRSVERAIAYEIERQAAILDAGEELVQETRGWHEDRGETYRMRVKETSDDYRYFPEPDLPPLHLDPAWLDALRARLAGAPGSRDATRYQAALGLSAYDAGVLVGRPRCGARCSRHVVAAEPGLDPKQVANWVSGEYLRLRNQGDESVTVDPVELGRLIRLVVDGSISRANGKEILELHVASGDSVAAIVDARGFRQISDAGAVGAAVDEVLAANPAAVADYRAGKAQAVGFLVGQVMKATRGQANAAVVQATVRERLASSGGLTVELINLALWIGGIALLAIGYSRARGPMARYQSLKQQDANIARYEAWRGGARDRGPTGASVADAAASPSGRRRYRDRRGRIRPAVRRVPRPLASDAPYLDRGAAVHHDRQATVMRDTSCVPAHDPELQPQAACAGGDGLVRVGLAQLGPPEHVDDVKRAGLLDGLGQRPVGTNAQHVAAVRVDRDAVVAQPLERPEHAERGPAWHRRRADDSDPPARTEQVVNGCVVENRDGAPTLLEVEDVGDPRAFLRGQARASLS